MLNQGLFSLLNSASEKVHKKLRWSIVNTADPNWIQTGKMYVPYMRMSCLIDKLCGLAGREI